MHDGVTELVRHREALPVGGDMVADEDHGHGVVLPGRDGVDLDALQRPPQDQDAGFFENGDKVAEGASTEFEFIAHISRDLLRGVVSTIEVVTAQRRGLFSDEVTDTQAHERQFRRDLVHGALRGAALLAVEDPGGRRGRLGRPERGQRDHQLVCDLPPGLEIETSLSGLDLRQGRL